MIKAILVRLLASYIIDAITEVWENHVDDTSNTLNKEGLRVLKENKHNLKAYVKHEVGKRV